VPFKPGIAPKKIEIMNLLLFKSIYSHQGRALENSPNTSPPCLPQAGFTPFLKERGMGGEAN
jgi:hypothetical protein